MIKKWTPLIVGIVAVTGILLFALQQIFVKTTLTEQEIINRVESLYNGSVEDITKNARHYNVVFSDGTKVYEVIVDEEQGTFRDLIFLADRAGSLTTNNELDESKFVENEETGSTEKKEVATNEQEQTSSISKPPTLEGDANNSANSESNSDTSTSSELNSSQPTPALPATPPVRISDSAANEIALTQLNGQIEDTDFYSTADGGYYIVEIETEEQEAAFQIHAITGKILSVVYDD